jgi:ATP-dependent Clp protease protease subunit
MNLMQLLKDNADKPRSWAIRQDGDEATVYVYDVIGGLFGGVDAEAMVRDLSGIQASTIRVRINSPGGDVFDGRAIATALRQHPAEVIAQVDGLAASAATTIAAAANRVEMAPGSFYMIHNAWTLAIGNKADMLEVAALLEKIDAQIGADYAARTGASAEQVAQWMDEETWFTAEEAVENGFADAVGERSSANAAAWNLSAYANAPKVEAPQEPAAPDRAVLERRLALLERISA